LPSLPTLVDIGGLSGGSTPQLRPDLWILTQLHFSTGFWILFVNF
jgi:hypothetical protein